MAKNGDRPSRGSVVMACGQWPPRFGNQIFTVGRTYATKFHFFLFVRFFPTVRESVDGRFRTI